jgi:hypothetical protein
MFRISESKFFAMILSAGSFATKRSHIIRTRGIRTSNAPANAEPFMIVSRNNTGQLVFADIFVLNRWANHSSKTGVQPAWVDVHQACDGFAMVGATKMMSDLMRTALHIL